MNTLSIDRGRYILPYVVGILSSLYYFSFYNYGMNLSDEGYLVYGVERLMAGQIPGCDFHAYMPGRYVILALFFKLFGKSIIVERLIFVAARVTIAVLFFRLSTKLLPPIIAAVPTLLLILIPGPWHKSFEMLFPIAWLLSVSFYLKDVKTAGIFVMSLVGGTTLFFRLEMGLLVLFLSLATIGMKHLFLNRTPALSSINKNNQKSRTLSYDIIVFLIAPLLIFLPYLIFLWFHSSVLKSFFFYVHELFAGLGGSNPYIRRLPSLAEMVFPSVKIHLGEMLPYFLYFFFMVYALVSARLIFRLVRNRWGSDDCFLCILTLYGIIQSYMVVSQPDRSHLLQIGPLAYLLTGFVLYQCYKKIFVAGGGGRSTIFLKKMLGIVFVCCSIAIPVIFVLDTLMDQKDFYYTGSFMVRERNMTKVGYSKAGVFVEPEQGAKIFEIINYINKNADIHDSLLTIPYFPMFNFLTERHNPTFYDIFFPHHVGSIANQANIINDIKNKQVKFIVATEGLSDPMKRGLAESRFRTYAKELVEFIENNYVVAVKSEPFMILEKMK